MPAFADCAHEINNHGGNRMAYYAQCSVCRWHLEYYPRKGPRMEEVEAMLKTFTDLQKAVAKTKGKGKGKAPVPKAKGKASPSSAPSRTMTPEELQAEIQRLYQMITEVPPPPPPGETEGAEEEETPTEATETATGEEETSTGQRWHLPDQDPETVFPDSAPEPDQVEEMLEEVEAPQAVLAALQRLMATAGANETTAALVDQLRQHLGA